VISLVSDNSISRDELEFALEHSDAVTRDQCELKRNSVYKELRRNSIETAKMRSDVKYIIHIQKRFDDKLDNFLVQQAVKRFIIKHKNKIIGIFVAVVTLLSGLGLSISM